MTGRGQKREQILRSLNGRRNAVDLAREVGCCPKYVRFVVRSAGRGRDLAPMAGGIVAQMRAMRASLNLDRLFLTPEVLAWVTAQATGGLSVEDVIRGILVDAWADDVEGQ